MRKSLYVRLLGLFLLVGVSSALVLGTLNVALSERLLRAEITGWLDVLADRQARLIDVYLQQKISGARTLALSPHTLEAFAALEAAMRRKGVGSPDYVRAEGVYLDYFRKYARTEDFHDLMLIAPDGVVVFNVAREGDAIPQVFDAPYRDSRLAASVRRVLSTSSDEISEFEDREPSQTTSAFIVTPLFEDGRLAGVLALGFDFPKLWPVLELGGTRFTTAETVLGQLRGDSMLYLTPLRKDRSTPLTFRLPFKDGARALPMTHALSGESGGGASVDYVGTPVIAAWRYLSLPRWGLVVKIDRAEAFGSIYLLLWLSGALAAAVVVLLAGVARRLAHSVTDPVTHLSFAAQRIAEGDLGQRVSVRPGDEIGDLAQAFNHMAERLQASYANLERIVEDRTRRLAGILRVAAEAIISTDANGIVIQFNQGAERIFGYVAHEVLGKPLDMLLPERFREAHRHNLRLFAQSREATRSMADRPVIYGLRKDGDEFPAEASLSRLVVDGEIILTVMLIDITARKQAEEEVIRQATHDPLTGLANRALFTDRLEQAVERARRANKRFAVLFVDLDGFKDVNDSLGHHAGDLLLQQVARRLLDCVRESDSVARLGGDEFTIILYDTGPPGDVLTVCEKLRFALSEPFDLEGNTALISSSIGVTLFPDDATDVERLIDNADEAMYAAKRAGKNAYRFYRAIS
ncbi:MAG TPA: diguanylate cyclase [Methylococcaceae bacterium]|nr:diguanylate cyclase [Methylococcaceae bacterium]